jgi:hypothetical protein
MKKKTMYLDFYKECLKTRRLPRSGLCVCLGGDFKSVFMPDEAHPTYGHLWHWAYNGEMYEDWDCLSISTQTRIEYNFSPLRQNMVLFMAAVNNEL